MQRRVLIACETSSVCRRAFEKLGWEAWSCDLLETEVAGNHYQCDVREVLDKGWDLLIAHPTCTYLTNSGVCWLKKDPTRWTKLDEAAKFFKLLLDAPIKYKCIENPIPHKYALERIGRKYDQLIQPYMFGHLERKATCLWLDGLPKLIPTNNVKKEMDKLPKSQSQRLHWLPPSPTRWKERSRTFSGIANALAEQYTEFFKTL